MKLIHVLHNNALSERYRSGLSGEKLGWAVYHAPELAFRPVHRIEYHKEDGPVIILNDSVFEIDPDTDQVFRTDDEAMDAHYKGAQQ